MSKKNVGKKRNRIDPIVHLAEQNKKKSITSVTDEKNKRKIKQDIKPLKVHNWNTEPDPRIADIDADTLFKEMKRRDF